MAHQLCTALLYLCMLSVCQAATYVNVSDTAIMMFSDLPTDTEIKAPNDISIVNKTGGTCLLVADPSKYELLTTDCDPILNFQIKSVNITDAGDYTCSISDCQQRLVVFGPPQLYPNTTVPILLYNANYNYKYFTLKILDYPIPIYSVQKLTPDGLIPLPPPHQIDRRPLECRIWFYNFDKDVFGTYQLKANNSEGILITNFTVAGPPEPPKNVIAWSTSPNSAHVSWQPGNSYNLTQTFGVYIKNSATLWKEMGSYIDPGSVITITATSLEPDTRYYFMVVGQTLGTYGFYSKVAEVVTIKPGEKQQDRPSLPPDDTPSSTTLPTINTGMGDREKLRFGAGIGIGIAIGVVVAVLINVVILVINGKLAKKKKLYTQPLPFPRPPIPEYLDLTYTTQDHCQYTSPTPSQ